MDFIGTIWKDGLTYYTRLGVRSLTHPILIKSIRLKWTLSFPSLYVHTSFKTLLYHISVLFSFVIILTLIDWWVGSGDEIFTQSINSIGKDVRISMEWMWYLGERREYFIWSLKMQEVEWNVRFSVSYILPNTEVTLGCRGCVWGGGPCNIHKGRAGRQPIPAVLALHE